jgi:deoxyribonuclease I
VDGPNLHGVPGLWRDSGRTWRGVSGLDEGPRRAPPSTGVAPAGFDVWGPDRFDLRPPHTASEKSGTARSAQVAFWNLEGRLNHPSSRKEVAAELLDMGGGRRWPEVVSVSVDDPAGVQALHREHLDAAGYHLVMPSNDARSALLLRGRPVREPKAWVRTVNGRTAVQIQRQSVQLGARCLTLFNVDIDAEALRQQIDRDIAAIRKRFESPIRKARSERNGEKASRLERHRSAQVKEVEARFDAIRADLGAALEDLVQAHRLRQPNEPVVISGNFVRAFDDAFFGEQGFDLTENGFSASGKEIFSTYGRNPSKPAKADELSSRFHLSHGTKRIGKEAYAPRANILVSPEMTDSGALARYVKGTFRIHEAPTALGQHRPVSVLLDLDPSAQPPSEGRIVAPGVRLAPFSKGPADRLSFDEPLGGSITYRVPTRIPKKELRGVIQTLQEHGEMVERLSLSGRDDLLERISAPRVRASEYTGCIRFPFDWSEYESLEPRAAIEKLVEATAPSSRLSFTAASRIHFHHLFNAGGTVTEPFRGNAVHVTDTDDPHSFDSIVNVEHIWPQSHGAGAPSAKGDLHLLIVMDSRLNSRRGNHPYGEVKPGTETWEDGPFKIGLDADGRTVFEPAGHMRGWIARAMLWSALRHGAELTDLDRRTYVAWSEAHPPTKAEETYTARVSVYQGNRNPFVDMPEAARVLAPHLGHSVNE